MLSGLAAVQVATLRKAGVASTVHRDSNQVTGLMVRQLGQRFLKESLIESINAR